MLAADDPTPRLISDERIPSFRIERVAGARAEPPVRGERLLRRLDGLFARLNRFAGQALPESLNPFAQMGAVANTTFLVALATGILLLFWYRPSVGQAYDSVEAMAASPYLAGLLRSLHRYSSDACMLFAALHGFQVLFARKIGGARWLAWVSGIALIGLLWFDGWTGYWLVWDERARQVALGSARLVDSLPLFPDPMARSFLTDVRVNSLFFFIIFFIHMLIPLAMGLLLWIHIMRMNRSKFLTGRPLSLAITAALVGLSLLAPATSAGPAAMQAIPQHPAADWYYLLPLFLTDRLQGSLLWTLALVAGALLYGAPWWIARRRAEPAVVDEHRCNGCTQCFHDCPYDAVSLLPREDDPAGRVFARIDPTRCVGCGICVGSCDSVGIDQSRLPVLDVRRWINHYAPEPAEDGQPPFTAFVCAESAGAGLRIAPDGSCKDLPGYRVAPVPCAGWVHMLTVERALRRGARGVLIAGCGAHPACREGANWTQERLDGAREPFLRTDKVAPDQVRYARFDRSNPRALIEAAAAFREGRPDPASERPPRRHARVAAVAVIVIGLGAAVYFPSEAPYTPPLPAGAELVVSFKHAGEPAGSGSGEATADEDLLPHMRGGSPARQARVPVRLRVTVDGRVAVEQSYEPGGLFDDGASVAIEIIGVEPGAHRVRVEIGDTPDPLAWPHTEERTLSFERAASRVVLFERGAGFAWH